MPIITSIKPQKSKKRVNIYLDNEFGFGIDLDNFVLLRLKLNQELSQEEIEKIVEKSEFQKTLDKLLRFATIRPRSRKEIETYFKRKQVHESLHKVLFNRLNRLELLDDKKFARWWIDQRISFRPKSRKVLINELKSKGINKDVIEEILLDMPIDEEKYALQELDRKSYKWEKLQQKKAIQKKMEYLLRKGFDYNLVEKIIKKR